MVNPSHRRETAHQPLLAAFSIQAKTAAERLDALHAISPEKLAKHQGMHMMLH